MNTQTEKSKDDYGRNFNCLSFALFPLYDSFHRLLTLRKLFNLRTLLGICYATFVSQLILITSLIKQYVVKKVRVNFTPI